ncbi:hypothetical protein [Sandaracinus amylolyticus]|uniref:Uncharacterized protein n=1 Tax=Sandaracinus amylolyticus TaxID=927083 RepID=A0A0F6SGA9_9BACT|nr:hypothetical protein [Sandaracinus amylolyticus]AKF08374.1 hypothetical protein DB32_005523 [Sandaracinus amylolyticus]
MTAPRSLRPALLVLGAALLAIATALVAPTGALAQTTPPDVVRLRDGSFLRGTIVERTPERVVVMLPTGETRTYAAAEVESAGPAEMMLATPVAPPPVVALPAAPIGPPMARLRVTTDDEELSLHQLTGSATVAVWTGRGTGTARIDQYAVICNAPCDTEIPAGTYQLGIAHGTGDAQRSGRPIDLRGDVDLFLEYEDRTGIRVAGWMVFIGGMIGGTLLMTLPVLTGSYGDNTGYLIGGGVLAGVSMAVGFPLIFMNNHAEAVVRF